jgi:hypothetical protein
MTSKLMKIWIPREAYRNFKDKQKRLELDLTKLAGRKIKIHMTNLLVDISQRPITYYPSEIFKLSKPRGKQ